MVHINFARREVNCKIVYYGPGLSGKTTNLEIVHTKAPDNRKGELTSIATEGDRTLFFDYMPLDLGKVGGMTTKFLLYTVPGQVYYDSTRKLVLEGADGIVFVADSQAKKTQDNIDSLKNLEKNLSDNGLDIKQIPLVIQWNKRDMDGILSVKELDEKINWLGVPTTEAVAVNGNGVMPTLKKLSELVLAKVNSELGSSAPARPTRRPASAVVRRPTGAAPKAPARPPAPARKPSSGAAAVQKSAAARRPSSQKKAAPPRARSQAPKPIPPAKQKQGSSDAAFVALLLGILVVVVGIVGAYVAYS